MRFNKTTRRLNEAFRSTFTGGFVYVTREFRRLPAATQAAVLKRVREAPIFFEERDPEHRAGLVKYKGREYSWIIYYRNRDDTGSSPNPASPTATRRMMRIMPLM